VPAATHVPKPANSMADCQVDEMHKVSIARNIQVPSFLRITVTRRTFLLDFSCIKKGVGNLFWKFPPTFLFIWRHLNVTCNIATHKIDDIRCLLQKWTDHTAALQTKGWRLRVPRPGVFLAHRRHDFLLLADAAMV
jgi:hypothetical protein